MNEGDRDDDRMLRDARARPASDTADEAARALRRIHPGASERALDVAADLGAFAPALLPLVLADPSVAEDATERPLDRADEGVHARFRTATADLEDDETLRRVLRRLRHRAMVRIALREVRGLADVDETSAELAALAGAALDAALRVCRRSLAARRGDALGTDGAPVPVVILGMGKLGGDELNPGSDVDICFFYESDEGATEGGDSVHDFFTRLTRRTSAAIADVTEDGFVFRVDLRLRPEGSRGPLANSLPSAERYYEAFGRTWERAALLRAQPVAGDHALGFRLLEALQPFVYRRVVDPSIAEAMHSMVVRSRRELSTNPERDVKLGRGGIREAEFFVQALQLIWGGRHPEVRSASTIDAARRLAGTGLLTQADLTALESAWALLRRVEHRIHLRAGYQTHDIPVGDDGEAFAHSLGFASSAEFLSALDAERAAVAALFDSLVEEPPRAEGLGLLLDACAEGTPPEELEPLVAQHLPVRDEHEAAAHLSRLSRRADAPLGPVQRLREPTLGALLLSEVADAADPDLALRGLADFFSRGGASYGRWLADEPRLARRLVGLLGASPTLGAALLGRTAQLGAIFSGGPPTAAEIQSAHDDPPVTERVSWLRRIKREHVLRIGLAHVAGELDLDATSRLLTALADAQVGFALREATAETDARLGPAQAPMAVVGMGKLGGEELGFGSDLDLLFLFEGEAGIERQTRVAQRTMRILSQLDAEGPGYETDARLRPSGSQGTLVRSLAAFEAYHDGSAEGWERQALVRARVVAATRDDFAGRLEETLQYIAYRRGAPEPTRVAALRARMQLELARERPRRYHPKLGYGALVDVEFTTQWLQMRHGDEERVHLRNTRDALQAMSHVGLEASATASDLAALKGARRFFREVEQAIHLLDPNGDGSLTFGGPRATAATRRLGLRARDGLTAEEVLEATWRRRAEETRAIFERTIAPVSAPPPWTRS